jgi:hypothetical protein
VTVFHTVEAGETPSAALHFLTRLARDSGKKGNKRVNCLYCEELVTIAEVEGNMALPINAQRDWLHRECLVRSVAGSVTHIRGECVRQGGTLDCHACEEGLTTRQAAINSFNEIRRRDSWLLSCNPN